MKDRYEGMDLDELEMELGDLNYAIAREMRRIEEEHRPGSDELHLENIKLLKEERTYVRKLVMERTRELMSE